MNLFDMMPGEKLSLEDMEPGLLISVDGLPGFVSGGISANALEIYLLQRKLDEAVMYVRLHIDGEGKFLTDDKRPVRVFRLEAPWP